MKNRIGEKWLTNEGYWVTIIVYRKAIDCDVKFDCGRVLTNVQYDQIKRGSIKNPYHPSIYGVGYIGEGKYKTLNSIGRIKSYSVWKDLLRRCYDKKQHIKQPSYKDCIVAESWHNFQNFAKWFEENYVEGFELDKDILLKGNKVYCSNLCCFVPKEVNTSIIKCNLRRGNYPIGVSKNKNKFTVYLGKNYIGLFNTPEEAFQAYKTAKEAQIKELAEKYKNKITEACYQALINYKVEIND